MGAAGGIGAVGGPAAWRGADIVDEDDWTYRFSADGLAALVARAQELAGPVRAGARPLADLHADEVRLAELDTVSAAIRSQLLAGRGYALVRGLPVDRLDHVENQVLYWLIGTQLATPIHQNEQREVLIRVRDQGKSFDDPKVRSYETAADLGYHSDSSDIVGLYCLHPAMQGGTSTVVSSVAVHDEVVRRRPDLSHLLYEPWPHFSPTKQTVGFQPICVRNDACQLFTRYGRKYVEMSPDMDASVAPLTGDQIAVLDLFDEITHADGYSLDVDFQPGDVQFLNNYVTMHARTEYVDFPDEQRKRELLRMWLVVRDGLDVPEAFAGIGFVSRQVAFR